MFYVLEKTRMELKTYEIHTCDKFKKGIREVFFSFKGGFQKCIEYIGKYLIHFRKIS